MTRTFCDNCSKEVSNTNYPALRMHALAPVRRKGTEIFSRDWDLTFVLCEACFANWPATLESLARSKISDEELERVA